MALESLDTTDGLYAGLDGPSDAKKRLALALLKQGSDASPVQSWSQGAARLAQGLFGGMALRNQDEADQAQRTRESADISSGLRTMQGGQGGPQVATAPTAPATGYAGAVAGAESSGDDAATNPNSSATGRYQFTEGTWNDLASRHPELKLAPDGRTDPAQQDRAMAAFTDENKATLAGAGVDPNPGNLYLAHFAGPSGALSVLKADPATPVSKVLSPDAIAANPFLQSMTAGDLAGWAAKKVGGAPNVQVASADPGFVPGGAPAAAAPMGVVPLPQPRPAGAPAADDSEDGPALSPGAQKLAAVMPQPAGATLSAGGQKLAEAMQPQSVAPTSPAAQRMTADPALVMRLVQSKNPGARAVGESLLKQMQGSESHAQETDANGNIWDVNRTTNQRTVALKKDAAYTAPYKDADGNLVQKDASGKISVISAADKTPTSVSEYNFYKSNLPPGTSPMPYETWSVQKARAGATNVTTTVGGENKGLDEARKFDAETVRKGQNDQMPALEDADHNFALMQDAIARNGGKLPTGGELGKLGLDWGRTKEYIKDNWGVDLGGDPNTVTSLETFNKGGIKAAGDMAKAIGGSRVLKVEFDMAQRANPGLETSDGGNKYLLDVNRNGIAIKRDYLQAQEDYWRENNHSLDGFQKKWKQDIHDNPRPLSNFSVAPPVPGDDGAQMVKLPSTAQGGYSWFKKDQNGVTPIPTDQAATLESATKQLKPAEAAPVTKTVGGKTYIKQDGNWFEK